MWQDTWISRIPARAPQVINQVSPQVFRNLSLNMKVEDLMDENMRYWDRELLSLIFLVHERSLIEEIGPEGIHSEYSYIWDYTKT